MPKGWSGLAAISTVTAPSINFGHFRSVLICCTLQQFTIRLPFLNGEQALYEPIHLSRQLWMKTGLHAFKSLSDLCTNTSGSNSTALFCLLELSPETSAESLFDFRFRRARKIADPCNIRTTRARRRLCRLCLGAERTCVLYLEHRRTE